MRQSPIPSLALLRTFHATAQLASLTKAATLRKRSQPAFTFAISKLAPRETALPPPRPRV
jgi:DNA-binding transcriptional LysR family regulator